MLNILLPRGGNGGRAPGGRAPGGRVSKNKYNIGTEILMLKRSLHNSTLRGRTEKSLNGNHNSFLRSIRPARSQGCRSNLKKVNFRFCILKIIKTIYFGRRRRNKGEVFAFKQIQNIIFHSIYFTAFITMIFKPKDHKHIICSTKINFDAWNRKLSTWRSFL